MIKDLRSSILKLRAQGAQAKANYKINEMRDLVTQCKSSNINATLVDCGIVDNNGNLLPPFAPDSDPNVIRSENYNLSSSMLPITGQNSSNIPTQATDRMTNAENLTSLSDRNNTVYTRTSGTEPQGTDTTSVESFSNIY